MADTTWTNQGDMLLERKSNRVKFIIGGAVLFAAIIYLVVNAISGGAQLFKTVDEFYAEEARLIGVDLKVAGWVVDETVMYTQIDATTSMLEFDIVGDLNDPHAKRLHVVAMNEPQPDLLQGQAEAYVEGHVGEDGIFYVNPGGLLLKCPTRYEELDPALHGQYSD